MTAGTEQAVKRRDDARRTVFTRRRVGVAIALLLLMAIVAVTIVWWRQPYTARAMRQLVRAFSEHRPVAGRLAGGFKGVSFAPPAEADALLQSPNVIEASRLADKAVAANESGAGLVYARLLLLTGDKGPATLKAFRQAVAAEPASAAATNDLGVCLLARNETEDALATFDAALRQQPEMPEALFNRAFCYQQLQLRDAAGADFVRLLNIERDAGWREEIRGRQAEVTAAILTQEQLQEHVKVVAETLDRACAANNIDEANRIAKENFTGMLNSASKEWFLECVKAVAAGDAEASQRQLFKIKLVGEHLAAVYGDRSLLELVAYAQGLSRESAAEEAVLVREYLEIADLRTAKAMSERMDDLQRLATRFKERGNRLFEYYAIYQPGFLHYMMSFFSDSIVKLKEAVQIADSRQWPYRRAIVLMQMGNDYASLSQDSLALNYGRQAISVGRELPYVESKSLQTMANACWHLGDWRQAIIYLHRSSDLFSTAVPSLTDLTHNLLQAAELYRAMGRHELALLYARQALAYAEAIQLQYRIAEATSFIAVEQALQNQPDESAAQMQRAFATLDKVAQALRAQTEHAVCLRAGDIASRQGQQAQAEQYYARAEAVAQAGGRRLSLIQVLKTRAESYVRAGQPVAARQDLERALALIEEYRKNITDRKNRNDFFDAIQDVFDQMVQLQAKQFGQGADAFNTAEQGRSRTLLEEIILASDAQGQDDTAAASATALTLDRVQQALPDNLTLISYSVSSSGTLIFVVSHKGFDFAESPATTEMLDRLTQDYIAGLLAKAPVEELAEPAHKLYELLIAPVESKLGATPYLCIAPDKALHKLPFGALVDGKGEYFISSHVLTRAPSASTLAYSLDKARAKGKVATESILAVGNPLFSRDHFPTLQSLPEAENEATKSASEYDHQVVLNGADATKARLLTELGRCDVAHFSAHCLVEERTPWLAALVLTQTSANKQDELLRLNEFDKIGLLRARLVILSACQSGLGQYYRGEGIVSLVRPFLAQGVPTVVASLWPVDSQATEALMIDFHRARRRLTLTTADALRNAQLQMMQRTSFSHPYYWAPFVVIGSGN